MQPTAITITYAGCVFHQNIFLYNIINTKCLIRKDQHIVYRPSKKKKKKNMFIAFEKELLISIKSLKSTFKKN